MKNQLLLTTTAALAASIGSTSAAVLLNPFMLTITETAFTDNAAPPVAYSTTDTLQTAFTQTIPQANITGSSINNDLLDETNIADATSGTVFGDRWGPANTANDNDGTDSREIIIEFNSNYLGGRQLSTFNDFVFATANQRRLYDLTYQFSTSSAPTTFTTFAQVKDGAVAANSGTTISISGFGAAFSDVRSIKVISTEAFTGTGEDQLAIHSEIDINLVPEPSSALLLGLGGAFLLVRRRK